MSLPVLCREEARAAKDFAAELGRWSGGQDARLRLLRLLIQVLLRKQILKEFIQATATKSDTADRTHACASLSRCESGSSHTQLHSRNNAAAPAAIMIADFKSLLHMRRLAT